MQIIDLLITNNGTPVWKQSDNVIFFKLSSETEKSRNWKVFDDIGAVFFFYEFETS